MSTVARKSGGRTVSLRERSLTSITGWDDQFVMAPDEVLVPDVSLTDMVGWLDRRISEAGLGKCEYSFFDSGILVRFRCKRDADIFRQIIDRYE